MKFLEEIGIFLFNLGGAFLVFAIIGVMFAGYFSHGIETNMLLVLLIFVMCKKRA